MISKSPQRNSFQRDAYLERRTEEGFTAEDEVQMNAMLELYSNLDAQKALREADPEWQKDNLEYDLRSTDWILSKVRASEIYSQNLYAALCNNSFIRNDVWPLLKNDSWGCSWRYAGGIIADMRQEGDYIDWYCSGIRGDWSDEEFAQATEEDQAKYLEMKHKYTGEGHVTDEVQEDLLRLGWLVQDSTD
jgi:hypothetical protein